MSSLVVAQTFGAGMTDAAGVVPAMLVLLSGGLVGMSIREMIGILGDDEDAGATGGDEQGMAGDGGLVAEDGDEELGGLDGLDDGGDDEFGDFGGDDEFGEMDEGGSDTDELEHRLDELETEVSSLSSTVNTVRNENEQISETVEEVEENVRKLLDIYEMVTRGVNPFADDIEPGGTGGGGSFGLFDDEDVNEDEALDDEIANADAEGFFDEDLAEEESSPSGNVDDVMDGDNASGGTSGGGFEDDGGTFDDAALNDMDGDVGGLDDFDDDALDGGDTGNVSESGGEGGKSFAELKDEYETGEADWAEEMGDADDVLEDDSEDLLEDDDGDSLAEDEDGGETAGAQQATESRPEPEPATDPEPEPVPDPESEPATQQEPDADSESREETGTGGTAAASDSAGTAATSTADADGDGKPYLATTPNGFASELVIVEWLEFLVDEVGSRETARAIDYYERIDWIADPVADDLQAYLRGFDAESGNGTLTIDQHTQSLRYISQLDGDAADAFALSELLGRRGGGSDGLQR